MGSKGSSFVCRRAGLLLGLFVVALLAAPASAGAITFNWSSPARIDSSSQLNDVSCPTAKLCVAVDGAGDVLWSTNPAGGAAAWHNDNVDSNPLTAISCPTTTLCVAGDTTGQLLTSTDPTGGPSAWTTLFVDGLLSVQGVSCASPSLCVAVDNSGDIAHSTNPTSGGFGLTNGVDTSNTFKRVSCPSTSLCVITDLAGNVITSTKPTSFQASDWTVTNVDSVSLYGISCPIGSTLCVAGDANGDVLYSNNPTGGSAAWSTTAIPSTNLLYTVSCHSTSECVALDDTGQAVVSANPTGPVSAWSVEAADSKGSPTGVSCPTLTLCVGVDQSGYRVTGAGTATLSVTTAGNGSGSVSSTPAGISCPGTCSASFPVGSKVTLKATAAAGSVFAGWSGAPGCANSTSCAVTMNDDANATATFNKSSPPPPGKKNLTVVLAGLGSGTVTGNGISCPGTCVASYNTGTSVTLTATPSGTSGFNPASRFAGWSGGGCSGTGPCTVTLNSSKTVTATFTLEPYEFAVTGISPSSGSEDGGTVVTITGSGFEPDSSVEFGHYYATGVTVESYTKLTAVSPPGSGTQDVRVKRVGQFTPVVAADRYSYLTTSGPAVTLLAPSRGAEKGGYTMDVWGKDFDNASSVTIGSTSETCGTGRHAACRRISPSELVVHVPAGRGTVRVVVHTPLGSSPANGYDQFTYVGKPVVGFVSGNPVPAATGGPVTIEATGIAGLSAIHVGAKQVYAYTQTAPNMISFFVPPGTGNPDITVTATGGTSDRTRADQVHYYTVPLVTAVSSNDGPEPGGYQAALVGENFKPGMAVYFGSARASSVHVQGSGNAIVTVPGGRGSVFVTVSVAGHTSPATVKFTYIPPPPPCATPGGSKGPFSLCNVSAWADSAASAIAIGNTPDDEIISSGYDESPPPGSPPVPNAAAHTSAGGANASGNGGAVASSFGLEVAGNASGFPTEDYPSPVSYAEEDAGLYEEWHLAPAVSHTVKLEVVFHPQPLASSGDGAESFDLVLTDMHCLGCDPIVEVQGWANAGSASLSVKFAHKPWRLIRGWKVLTLPFTIGPGEYPAFDLLETMRGYQSAQCGLDAVYACYGDTGATLDPVLVSLTPGYTAAPNFDYHGSTPVLTGPQAVDTRRGHALNLSGMALGPSAGRVQFVDSRGRHVSAAVQSWSDGSVTTTVPRGVSLGQAMVSVITSSGAASNSIPISIGNGHPAPVVESVSPSIAGAGALVRIKGIHLRGASAVLFGGRAGRHVRVLSGREVEAMVPRGASSGDVTVVTRGGSSERSDGSSFTYLPSVTRRLGAAGGTVSLPGGARLVLLPTELRRRTRVTLSMLAPGSVHGRLRRAARHASLIVAVHFSHRPARAVELELPGAAQNPMRPKLWRILGRGGAGLITGFLRDFVATASISHSGTYALVPSR